MEQSMPIKALFLRVYMTIAAWNIILHLSYWAKHGHMAISVICYLENQRQKSLDIHGHAFDPTQQPESNLVNKNSFIWAVLFLRAAYRI